MVASLLGLPIEIVLCSALLGFRHMLKPPELPIKSRLFDSGFARLSGRPSVKGSRLTLSAFDKSMCEPCPNANEPGP